MSFGSRFVQNPGLFPGRIGGDPWGGKSIAVEFAGGTYCFDGLCPSQRDALGRWQHLTVDDPVTPSAHIEVFRAPSSDFLEIETRGWTYEIDLEYRPRHISLAGLDFMARLELSNPMRGGLWTCHDRGRNFAGQFENYLRIAVAYGLQQRAGILVHSAAIVEAGRAYVFFGRSGVGKTTISRRALDSGRIVLSDDMNVIAVTETGVHVEEVPFAGEFAGLGPRRTFPLRAILSLAQDVEHQIEPLSKAEAAARLLSCVPFVNRDPHRVEALTSQLASLVERVPLFSLRFSLRPGLWTILKKL